MVLRYNHKSHTVFIQHHRLYRGNMTYIRSVILSGTRNRIARLHLVLTNYFPINVQLLSWTCSGRRPGAARAKRITCSHLYGKFYEQNIKAMIYFFVRVRRVLIIIDVCWPFKYNRENSDSSRRFGCGHVQQHEYAWNWIFLIFNFNYILYTGLRWIIITYSFSYCLI